MRTTDPQPGTARRSALLDRFDDRHVKSSQSGRKPEENSRSQRNDYSKSKDRKVQSRGGKVGNVARAMRPQYLNEGRGYEEATRTPCEGDDAVFGEQLEHDPPAA